MSTKNNKYSFIEQSFSTTFKNQNYNLNLNQSKKCPIFVPVQRGNVATDSIVYDNCERKEKVKSWNKSFNIISPFTTLNEDNNDFKKRWKNENTLKTTIKSSLSLHITAYENSNEAAASDLFGEKNVDGLKKEEFGSIKTSKQFFTDAFKPRNPFEFPRQQEGDQKNGREIMPFKASQQLIGSEPPTLSQQIENIGEQMVEGDQKNGREIMPFKAYQQLIGSESPTSSQQIENNGEQMVGVGTS
uniref:C2 NT-type domain-containing protein n=1 Tax=Panagrolaimus sp. PS1159 TaxID=55785 RepID=A0AC35GSL3_9BILA